MFSYEHSKLGYLKKKQRYINFKSVSRLLAQQTHQGRRKYIWSLVMTTIVSC